MNIVHLTSIHNRYDTRIYIKQCRSIVNYDFKVSLIVADGNGDEVKDGIAIYDVGKPKSRIRRMFLITRQIFLKAKELNADVYHFHDPELIPTGLKLKRLGKKVIFDSHEDLPQQILSKPYLKKPVRLLLSRTLKIFESWACRRFDAIITATPAIKQKFDSIHPKVININNYPTKDELVFENTNWSNKQNQICYVGGITAIRGIKELVKAMELVTHGTQLKIAGEFSESNFVSDVKSLSSWKLIDELGLLSRRQVQKLMDESIAGIVTFLPVPNHLKSQPNKMFEYMSAGIPVIASDFPLWKKIIEGFNCGICVNPNDPNAIANAIDYLVSNQDIAKKMGERGKEAVKNNFTWQTEEIKLIKLYNNLINR